MVGIYFCTVGDLRTFGMCWNIWFPELKWDCFSVVLWKVFWWKGILTLKRLNLNCRTKLLFEIWINCVAERLVEVTKDVSDFYLHLFWKLYIQLDIGEKIQCWSFLFRFKKVWKHFIRIHFYCLLLPHRRVWFEMKFEKRNKKFCVSGKIGVRCKFIINIKSILALQSLSFFSLMSSSLQITYELFMYVVRTVFTFFCWKFAQDDPDHRNHKLDLELVQQANNVNAL